MLGVVNGFPVEPLDAGHANSTGPRKGLIDVYPDLAALATTNAPAVIGVLDRRTEELAQALNITIGQTETVLCDWHSMLKGNYYVGHDIDMMLEQAHRPSTSTEARRLIVAARQHEFDATFLGERNGWTGVRRDLKRAYRDQGRIVWWE